MKKEPIKSTNFVPGDVEKVTPKALLKQKNNFFFFSRGHLKKKKVGFR